MVTLVSFTKIVVKRLYIRIAVYIFNRCEKNARDLETKALCMVSFIILGSIVSELRARRDKQQTETGLIFTL